jgi:protein YIPF1/2
MNTEYRLPGYLHDESSQSKGGFWTVEYYQPYFDVDTQTVCNPLVTFQSAITLILRTSQVLRRCYATLLPTSTSYLSTHLNPADLYGPFWTLTTLIFTLFLSSSLAASISAYLSAPGSQYDYNFQLLSIAVSLVYAYGLAIPVLLWLALRYIGVGEWSIVEVVAIWGYGQFVWIPVSVSHARCEYLPRLCVTADPFPM